MTELLFNLSYQCFSITLIVLATIGIFYTYGELLSKFFKISKLINTFNKITSGMALIVFVGWYSYGLGLSVSLFILVICIISIMLVLFKTIKNFKKPNSAIGAESTLLLEYYPIIGLILFFTIQAIIAFQFFGQPTGRISNNDIFNWSLMADHFLGNANLNNIPGGGDKFNALRVDAWGTYFILGMLAKIGAMSALEVTSSFSVLSLTIITLGIKELTKKAFSLSSNSSFLVAILTGGGSFFFYITYNGFYGQLLGTIFFLALLLSVLNIFDQNRNKILTKNLFFLIPPFVGLLLVYQSGFLIFTFFVVAFCTLLLFFERFIKSNSNEYDLYKLTIPLFQLLLSLATALVILPEMFMHTISRTFVVSNVVAGWPLPLISPLYLISLPVWQPFPQLMGTPAQFIVFVIISISCLALYLYKFKEHTSRLSSQAISILVLLYFSISIYLLAYFIKGNIYQVWKISSFAVLPVSFSINAIIVKNILDLKIIKINKKIINYIYFFLYITILCWLLYIPTLFIMDSYSRKISSLKAVRVIALAEGVHNIVLGTAPYGDTMAAFNYLSKDFKLLTLSNSYYPISSNSDLETLDKKNSRLLMPAKCSHPQNNPAIQNEFILVPIDAVNKLNVFEFNSTYYECHPTSWVKIIEGFSDSEPWGTWTIGNKAAVKIQVPTNLYGKDLMSRFEVNPFGSQVIDVTANGVSVGKYSLSSPSVIEIKIPSGIVKSNSILFEFFIATPRLAREYNPENQDPRLLGLGFLNFSLYSAVKYHQLYGSEGLLSKDLISRSFKIKVYEAVEPNVWYPLWVTGSPGAASILSVNFGKSGNLPEFKYDHWGYQHLTFKMGGKCLGTHLDVEVKLDQTNKVMKLSCNGISKELIMPAKSLLKTTDLLGINHTTKLLGGKDPIADKFPGFISD